MKPTALVIFAVALAAGIAVCPLAWGQMSTESETTITTIPVAPSVTTRTVTTAPAVSPAPQVIVVPAGTQTTYTTTATTQLSPPILETEGGGQVLGTVTQGNSTIVFEVANVGDIHTNMLGTWDDFAQAHPQIESTLAYKPWLINDPGYLERHPELNEFFQEHPDIKMAMNADPGNFAAIPPRPGE